MAALGERNGHYKDGRFRHPLYATWANMIARCKYGRPHYEHVSVCDDWLDFAAFLAWAESAGWYKQDASTPPADRLTIDRIDTARGYEPSNCRWITKAENSRLARLNDSRRIAVDIRAQALRDVADGMSQRAAALRHGISQQTISKWVRA